MELKDYIRDVPDFPKKGIVFKDITTLLREPEAFKHSVERFKEKYGDAGVSCVVGIESRGFIFGAALAHELGAAFVPLRKPGKLPYKTIRVDYELEYGSDAVEVHEDGIHAGEKVLVVDDLLATGGTAKAAVDLVERLGGNVCGIAFLVELGFLNGREKLSGHEVYSLVKYDKE